MRGNKDGPGKGCPLPSPFRHVASSGTHARHTGRTSTRRMEAATPPSLIISITRPVYKHGGWGRVGYGMQEGGGGWHPAGCGQMRGSSGRETKMMQLK